jgi:hypothetical protein
MRSVIDEKLHQLEMDEARLLDALKRVRTEKAALLDRKIAQSDEKDLENQREKQAAGQTPGQKAVYDNRVKNTINNNEGVHKPLQLVCFICAEEFGTNSLKIHQKSW